jgi:hypothetical protein
MVGNKVNGAQTSTVNGLKLLGFAEFFGSNGVVRLGIRLPDMAASKEIP